MRHAGPPAAPPGVQIRQRGSPGACGTQGPPRRLWTYKFASGGRLGRAPITLGEVARYGFVLDPDGNWIELVEMND